MNVNHHSLRIDTTDLQVNRFADSQTQCVGRPQKRFESKGASGVDDLKDLRLGDDFWECEDSAEFSLVERLPVSRASRSHLVCRNCGTEFVPLDFVGS